MAHLATECFLLRSLRGSKLQLMAKKVKNIDQMRHIFLFPPSSGWGPLFLGENETGGLALFPQNSCENLHGES